MPTSRYNIFIPIYKHAFNSISIVYWQVRDDTYNKRNEDSNNIEIIAGTIIVIIIMMVIVVAVTVITAIKVTTIITITVL